jgi:hypothetical protein
VSITTVLILPGTSGSGTEKRSCRCSAKGEGGMESRSLRAPAGNRLWSRCSAAIGRAIIARVALAERVTGITPDMGAVGISSPHVQARIPGHRQRDGVPIPSPYGPWPLPPSGAISCPSLRQAMVPNAVFKNQAWRRLEIFYISPPGFFLYNSGRFVSVLWLSGFAPDENRRCE